MYLKVTLFRVGPEEMLFYFEDAKSVTQPVLKKQHPPQGAAAAVTVQAASSTAAAAVTARGLSPLAMALRQQQQQLQLQALATGGSVVSTLPIGASPVIQQQQVVSVAGVQGGRGGAGGQMQQSVVLPVRTTPLAGATGTATHTVRHSDWGSLSGAKGARGLVPPQINNRSALSTNAQSRFSSVVISGVLGPCT